MSQNTQAVEEFGRRCRRDFPIFDGGKFVYLDSAASAQKPRSVIDAVSKFYASAYSNVHRGIYRLAEEATERFENVREPVRAFIGAKSAREIIFTRGTTESINLVAYSWGRANIQAGDEILVTLFEHHANFVPWQILAQEKGAVLRFIPFDKDCQLDREVFRKSLSSRTKLLAITQLSNALGMRLPVEELIREAHAVGAVVLVDGAQGVVHEKVDVQIMEADFYAFSGHKLYGPTGVGVLYGRESLLESMPPFLSGGEMIRSVSVHGTTFNDLPTKFEAGTPPITSVIGFGVALDYLLSLGVENIYRYETFLTQQLEASLQAIDGVKILGPVGKHHGLVSFVVDGLHPHDVSQVLAASDICVRAGHHCAQPAMEHLGLTATTRASLGLYNTLDDIKLFCEALQAAIKMFQR